MSLDEKKYREIVDGPCFMCDGSPVVAVSCYQAHQPPRARRRSAMFYGLCCDCMAEVKDERTQKPALAAIERRVAYRRSRPPWEIRAGRAPVFECFLPRQGRKGREDE